MLYLDHYKRHSSVANDAQITMLYQGYYPHKDNTLISWKECLVVAAVVTKVFDPQVPKGIEAQWVRTWEFLNKNDKECVERAKKYILQSKTAEEFEQVCTIGFCSALGVTDGYSFVNWMRFAPKTPSELIEEFGFLGKIRLSNALRRLQEAKDTSYMNPDVALIFRAFRLPMTETEDCEAHFAKEFKEMYKEDSPDWKDNKEMVDAFNEANLPWAIGAPSKSDKCKSQIRVFEFNHVWQRLFFKDRPHMEHYKGRWQVDQTFAVTEEEEPIMMNCTPTNVLQQHMMELLDKHMSRWLYVADMLYGRSAENTGKEYLKWLMQLFAKENRTPFDVYH
jgi:hypothetical protein